MANEHPHDPGFDPHRCIGEISGEFFVPAYQRGYRWTVDDVTRLLDDIEQSLNQHKDKPYTLQPIVVRRRSSGELMNPDTNQHWELIDGQQRLTTIYLIFLVMRDTGWKKMPLVTHSSTRRTTLASDGTTLRPTCCPMPRQTSIFFIWPRLIKPSSSGSLLETTNS